LHLAGDLRVGVQTLTPPATFNPRLPPNFTKNDSHSGFEVSAMIDFAQSKKKELYFLTKIELYKGF